MTTGTFARLPALVLFLLAAFCLFITALPGGVLAGSNEGKKIFDAGKCASCHQVKGPATEKTIQDVLAKKGPELWYSGSKFRPGFLEGWLKDPRPIRPMRYYSLTEKNPGDHPRLAPGDAAEVAAYLMSLKSAEARPSGIRPGVDPGGRAVFMKEQACYSCHQVTSRRGNAVGGLTGPSLVGAGSRLEPDWIYAYLSNPKVFKPVKDMPNYVGILDDSEMKALASYISSFK